ncbi:MAG: DUF3793 family protein [Collinsella aerofaciens]
MPRAPASRITLASNNAAECACGRTRCALSQQASRSNDCTCEFPHEIGYFLGYPTTTFTSLSPSAARTTKSLGLEGLHERRAGACDV